MVSFHVTKSARVSGSFGRKEDANRPAPEAIMRLGITPASASPCMYGKSGSVTETSTNAVGVVWTRTGSSNQSQSKEYPEIVSG
eukprot:scaffold877_cov362-Prasinococcus_capsulatus_cf.AAC.4